MMKLTIIFAVLVLICVEDLHAWWSKTDSSRSSSSSRSSNPVSTNMNKKELTNLYNSKVTKVQHHSRPMSGVLGKIGIKHTGVVATTQNGGRYLIHKGLGYGKASSTVITDAKHMSSKWTPGLEENSWKTISDLMKDGYVDRPYGVFGGRKICWDASRNIMNKSGRRKRSC